MELECAVQNYEWGKKGLCSKVALLLKSANPDYVVEPEKPYAELWMGTHPNAPSKLKTSKLLSNLFTEHPEYLGSGVLERFGANLPFLFKVLSVNEALSIQVHPSKKLAEELHKKHPDIYKDPNHKPELAIALTPFQALCGFRPINEIKQFLRDVPELKNIIGAEPIEALLQTNCDRYVEALKHCFSTLMSSETEAVGREICNLTKRLKNEDENVRAKQMATLVENLNCLYEKDVGILCVYFFNYLELKPLQAIYLPANEPHAYLYGDCIECMASSDNVIRAGLTPKFKDVSTLCSMLNYEGEKGDLKLFEPIKEDHCSELFQPPIPDFAVVKIQIPAKIESYTLIKRKTASILLTISGKCLGNGTEIKPGTILFLPANFEINLEHVTGDLMMFQALANV